MLKPTYRNRGGKPVQKINVVTYVCAESLINIIAHMIHMEEKVSKASVEKSLRLKLWSAGSDGIDYLAESICEEEREECLEQGEAKARELFPEFFA